MQNPDSEPIGIMRMYAVVASKPEVDVELLKSSRKLAADGVGMVHVAQC